MDIHPENDNELQRDAFNVDVLLEAFAKRGGRGLSHNGAIELLANIGRLVLERERNDCAYLAALARKHGLLRDNHGAHGNA